MKKTKIIIDMDGEQTVISIPRYGTPSHSAANLLKSLLERAEATLKELIKVNSHEI